MSEKKNQNFKSRAPNKEDSCKNEQWQRVLWFIFNEVHVKSDCVDRWWMSYQLRGDCVVAKWKKKPWTECQFMRLILKLIHSIRPNICFECSRYLAKKKKQIESTWRVFISILIFYMYTFNYMLERNSVKHLKKKLVHL